MNVIKKDQQIINEERFNRKHIDKRIRSEYTYSEHVQEKVKQGVEYLNDWLSGEFYESKRQRLDVIKVMDIEALVLELFVGIAYCQTPEKFTSVSAMMASRLKFSDHADSIKTVAEILGVLCYTDAFDIFREHTHESLYLQSKLPLSPETMKFIHDSSYLPPMVCLPDELTRNYQSAYLTHNDSLILGNGNHHEEDICLDVLNKKNSVPLKLDMDILMEVDEVPKEEPKTIEEMRNWNDFKKQSNQMYLLMVQQGNEFYLTHKYDKRLRVYSQGYHINTQGSAFKKAIIELVEEEIVDGVVTGDFGT